MTNVTTATHSLADIDRLRELEKVQAKLAAKIAAQQAATAAYWSAPRRQLTLEQMADAPAPPPLSPLDKPSRSTAAKSIGTIPDAQWNATVRPAKPRRKDRAKPDWTGVCQKCGAKRAAVSLVATLIPFGRGEQWVCVEGCGRDREERARQPRTAASLSTAALKAWATRRAAAKAGGR